MKLSQCMIVKNEEKNIRRALSWGKGIVYEQIVVDTGSTDRTVEIAKEMGAKVYHFTWVNDFAAAKNYAIEQAKGDWIAFLDADEYFSVEDARKLSDILNVMEKRRYQVNGLKKKCNIIIAAWVQLNAQGEIIGVFSQKRLFRNQRFIRYNGIIHEELSSRSNEPLVPVDMTSELSIYHTGYAWIGEEKGKKGERNIELLKKELEKNPNKATTHLYLAEALSLKGDKEQSLYYAELATKNIDGSLVKERLLMAFQMLLYGTYGKLSKEENGIEKMETLYQSALKADNNYPDFDIAMGFFMYLRGRWVDTIHYLEQAFRKAAAIELVNFSQITEVLKEIYAQLLSSYQKLGNQEKTLYYATFSLQVDPYQTNILKTMILSFIYIDQISANEIMDFLKKLYDLSKRKDVLFLMKVVKLVNNRELEDCLKPFLWQEDRKLLYPNG